MHLAKTIFTILLTLRLFTAGSQSISHLQQFPLFINPALMTEKGLSKAGIYYNTSYNNFYQTTEKTLAGNYEGLWKNLVYGVMVHGVQNTQDAGNNYGSLKAGIGYMLNLKRKQRTRNFSIVPAISYTYAKSNNVIYVDTYKYSNDVVRTSDDVHFANYIFTWPGHEHNYNLGIAYRSDKTTLGIDYTYATQNAWQQNLYYSYSVPYLYDDAYNPDEQIIIRNNLRKESDSIQANKSFRWTQSLAGLYFSQRADFGQKKNFSLTFFAWYTYIRRYNLIRDLEIYYSEDDNIDFGVISRFKNILFGVQLGTRVSEILLVGYKTQRLSIMAGYGGYHGQIYGSVSLNYYFKRSI